MRSGWVPSLLAMANQPLPSEVVEAAATHGSEAHGAPFPPSSIGPPHSRAERIRITWAEHPELGLYITCRDCPESFGRYFVEVEREQPTPRLLALIAGHFGREHPEVSFTPDRVWHLAQQVPDRLATFMPMVPQLGASIICACCREGSDRVYVTTPPYGDGRRLRWLLSEHPKLRSRTLGFSSREQADHLEAWDRGLLRPDARAGRQALELARHKQGSRKPDIVKDALATILRERVNAGKGVTRVIEDLAAQSMSDPAGFACAIGMAIPTLARSRSEQTDAEFADQVRGWLDKEPTTSNTTLWRLWACVKRSE